MVNHQFFKIAIMAVVAFTGQVGSQRLPSCEFQNVSLEFPNYIYDVTRTIQESGEENFFCNHSTVISSESLSTRLYYTIVPNETIDVPENVRKYFARSVFGSLLEPYNVLPEISFITNDMCGLHGFISDDLNPGYYPDAIILKRLDKIEDEESCENFCKDSIWIGYPNENVSVLGIELNRRLLHCALFECEPSQLEKVQILVLDEYFSSNNEISYGSYLEGLDGMLYETLLEIRKINTMCEFYLRISIEGHSVDEKLIFASYANLWVKLNKMAKVIIDSVPDSVGDEDTFGERNVYPYLPTDEKLMDFETSCQLITLRWIAGSVYKNIVIDLNLDNSSIFVPKCNQSNARFTTYFVKMPMPNLNVRIESEEQALKLLEMINKEETDVKLETIYVVPRSQERNETYPEDIMQKIWKLASSLNVSIACIHKLSYDYATFDMFEHYPNACDNWFNHSQKALFEWVNFQPQPEGLSHQLIGTIESWKRFLEKYPRGNVDVWIYIPSTSDGIHNQNLYCSPLLTNNEDLQSTLVLWSEIHNFTVIIEQILHSENKSGHWFNLLTDDNLNRRISDFPVLIRRRVPETMKQTNQTPYTFPCIYRTTHLLNTTLLSGRLDQTIYSGITVNLQFNGGTPMSTEYMQQLLAFAFQRFAQVELRGSNDMDRISKVLSTDLYEALLPRVIADGGIRLYIELSDMETFEENLRIIEGVVFRPHGIHLAEWETQEATTQVRISQILKEYFQTANPSRALLFGITVKNCTHQINSRLTQLRSLDYLPFIKYVVCVLMPVRPENENKHTIQKYLDTQFYIKNYLNATLNVEVIFRMSFLPKIYSDDPRETEDYLRFFKDSQQYSEGYGVNYFMGDAFTIDEDNLWSWWIVAKNNSSKFTELESEYFGRPTEQIYKIPQITVLDRIMQNIPLIIGLSTILVTLLATVCALWIYNRRMRKRLLSKEEVNAFRYGELVEQYEEPIGIQYIQVNTVKTLGFNSGFEIKKKNIELDTVVGRGNFGVVYSATLSGSRTVAVKIPNPDCCKEIFKSLLDEVKILCYIGNHLNVISFVGAYTREIDMGIIYIVTEFCQNGSLEKNLQNRKVLKQGQPNRVETNAAGYIGYVTENDMNVETTRAVDHFDLKELLVFAYEIASGMNYIADKKVVHSDLSTRNVLLNASMTCKIGDFGLSRKLYENPEYIKKGGDALPWRWMAVESLAELKFTTKSDVWSYGVTLWEIFTLGDIPYPGISWSPDFADKLQEGLCLPKPQYASSDIYEMMLKCCTLSPESRPRFSDLSDYFLDLVI